MMGERQRNRNLHIGSFHVNEEQGSGRQTCREEVVETETMMIDQSETRTELSHDGEIIQDFDVVELPQDWSWVTNWKLIRTPTSDFEGWNIDKKDHKKRWRIWQRMRVQEEDGKGPAKKHLSSFQDACEELVSKLAMLNADHQTLLESTNRIGTARDGPKLRKSLQDTIEAANWHIGEAELLLDELRDLEKKEPVAKQRMLQATGMKIERDLKHIQAEVEKIIRVAKKKNKEIEFSAVDFSPALGEKAVKESLASKKGTYMTRSQRDENIGAQLVLQSSVDVNLDLMHERESDLSDINKDLHFVKEMMNEVGTLVSTQGGGVAEIEHNADATLEETTKGLKHLEKAQQLQQETICNIS